MMVTKSVQVDPQNKFGPITNSALLSAESNTGIRPPLESSGTTPGTHERGANAQHLGGSFRYFDVLICATAN
jgi:hypothetical protein